MFLQNCVTVDEGPFLKLAVVVDIVVQAFPSQVLVGILAQELKAGLETTNSTVNMMCRLNAPDISTAIFRIHLRAVL